MIERAHEYTPDQLSGNARACINRYGEALKTLTVSSKLKSESTNLPIYKKNTTYAHSELYIDLLFTKLVDSRAHQTDSRLQCMGINGVTKELNVFADKSSQSKVLVDQLFRHSFSQHSLGILGGNGMDIQNSPATGIRETSVNNQGRDGRDISRAQKLLAGNHISPPSSFNSAKGGAIFLLTCPDFCF